MRERLTQEVVAGLQVNGRDRLVFDARVPGFGVRITGEGARAQVSRGHEGDPPPGKRHGRNVPGADDLRRGLRAAPPTSNPGHRIKMYRERARERFLSEDEIGTAAEAIASAELEKKIGPHAAAGLRLPLFIGARSGEITAAQ